MTLEEYQLKALKTAVFKDPLYPVLGLAGEAGEVADKYKKILRDKDGKMEPEDKTEIAFELGDVLWYVAILADELGYDLEDIADMNIEKLKSRQDRNKLGGSGDTR